MRGCFSTIARSAASSVLPRRASPRRQRRATRPSSRPPLAVAAVRHRRLDRRAQRAAAMSGRSLAAERWCCDRHHAAADVDADRRRDDRAARSAMTLPTVAPMPQCTSGITATCWIDERQPRDVLRAAGAPHPRRHAARPRLDRHPRRLDELVIRHDFRRLALPARGRKQSQSARDDGRIFYGKSPRPRNTISSEARIDSVIVPLCGSCSIARHRPRRSRVVAS